MGNKKEYYRAKNWIDSIPDINVRDKIYGYINDPDEDTKYKDLNKNYDTCYDTINWTTPDWASTKEGFDYWDRVTRYYNRLKIKSDV